MNCLTGEQLARVALGLGEDAQLSAHLAQCDVCRGRLAELMQVRERLAAAHADLERGHAKGRAMLMESLTNVEIAPPRAVIWERLAGLTVGQRIAVGGVGVSAIAAAVLWFLIFSSAGQLSAMERMCKRLQEVKSYSYKATWDVDRSLNGEAERWVSKTSGEMLWRAPDAWHDESKIVQFKGPQRTEITIEHFSETFPVGKDGILIDHQRKTFLREANEPIGSKTYPLDILRLVQENSGDVVRDLGFKEIRGKQARGFVMTLKGAHEGRQFEPVDVWVDPETDLPMEIGNETKDPSGTTVMRLYDFRWNIELVSKLFEAMPPEGYTDVTPPVDEKSIAQISTALRLYAELSGGHYPPAEKFKSEAVREEMLRMAGFTGPPQTSWENNKKYQEIEKAKTGLDWIGRMALNEPNAGYFGGKVGPNDKEKVLLWWLLGTQGYRVFYGDLQTKVVKVLNVDEAVKQISVESLTVPAEDKQSAGKFSAIERMTKRLQEVKSYSLLMTEHITIQQKNGHGPGLITLTQKIWWQAPGLLREELKSVMDGDLPKEYHKGEENFNDVVISRVDGPGIFIDYLNKTFSRLPKLRVEDTSSGSITYPHPPVESIRELAGKVMRDLGTKEIDGKQAHGYMMAYKRPDEGWVELWVDSQTDLPLEAGWETKDEASGEVMRMTEFRWNTELNPKLFDATPPEGFTDITPPPQSDEKTFAQMVQALKLYAELSGGHYPQIDTYEVKAKFDADAIYAEMLKMAGFQGPVKSEWLHDPKYLEIEAAKSGLDWMGKILLSPISGYRGSKVGPGDKNKPLFWWLYEGPEGCRVFYGDLRSESLSEAEGKKILPPRPKMFDDIIPDESKAEEKLP